MSENQNQTCKAKSHHLVVLPTYAKSLSDVKTARALTESTVSLQYQEKGRGALGLSTSADTFAGCLEPDLEGGASSRLSPKDMSGRRAGRMPFHLMV